MATTQHFVPTHVTAGKNTEKKIGDQMTVIMQKRPEDRSVEEVETLAPWVRQRMTKILILNNLNGMLLQKLCRHVRILPCDGKQFVFKQGEAGELFYVLLQGSVGLYLDNDLNVDTPAEQPNLSLPPRHGAVDKSPTKKKMSRYRRASLTLSRPPQRIVDPEEKKEPDAKLDPEDAENKAEGEAEDKAEEELNNYVVKLAKGMGFGEVALQEEGATRSASIRTLEASVFLTVDKDTYLYITKHSKADMSNLYRKIACIEKFFPFSNLDKFSRTSLRYCLADCKFVRNDVVVQVGRDSNSVYFVNTGQFTLHILSDPKDLGSKEIAVSTIGEGQFFGERELLQWLDEGASTSVAPKRQITVTMTSAAGSLFRLPKEFFRRFIRGRVLKEFRDRSQLMHDARQYLTQERSDESNALVAKITGDRRRRTSIVGAHDNSSKAKANMGGLFNSALAKKTQEKRAQEATNSMDHWRKHRDSRNANSIQGLGERKSMQMKAQTRDQIRNSNRQGMMRGTPEANSRSLLPALKPGSRPGSKPGSRPGSKPGSRPGSKPGSRTGSRGSSPLQVNRSRLRRHSSDSDHGGVGAGSTIKHTIDSVTMNLQALNQ